MYIPKRHWIEREGPLNEIQLKLEAVTPIFLYGAPSTGPELRGAPFRGQLRYWYRTFHPGLSMDDLAKAESTVFGSTEIGSRFDLSIYPSKPKPILESRQVLPHKGGFRLKAFPEGFEFSLKTRLKDDTAIVPIMKALLLFLNFGGIGKRERRGFGSLQVKRARNLNIPVLYKQGQDRSAATEFKDFLDIKEHVKSVLDFVLENKFHPFSDMSVFPQEHANTVGYPSFADNSWCIFVSKKAFADYEAAMVDFWNNHLTRNGIKDGKAFGYANGGRRASPFHLHLTKALDGYHLILTAFNSLPVPIKGFWDKHYQLYESCLNAYKGVLFSSQKGGGHDA